MDREARLRRALEARGSAWPAPLEWHGTLGSTNDVLKVRARLGAPEWTAVMADTQTGGRGREGRAWVSPPGGLYLSVLLRPHFPEVGLVPLAAGVAVAEVAAESGVVAEVKWPNDILVRGRKLAGVLTESSSSSGRVDWVVVGIGVNVAVAPATSPGSVHDTATSPVSLERPATSSHSVDRSATSRDHVDHTATSPVSLERSATSRERVEQSATSLDREGDRTPAVEDVAAGVLARLVVWYDALETRPSSVVEAWRQRAVPWWGSPVEVRTVRGGVRGSLRGVDESGALLVDREDGTVERVLSGEVTRLRAVAPERRET